jgi:hypothetical protein
MQEVYFTMKLSIQKLLVYVSQIYNFLRPYYAMFCVFINDSYLNTITFPFRNFQYSFGDRTG